MSESIFTPGARWPAVLALISLLLFAAAGRAWLRHKAPATPPAPVVAKVLELPRVVVIAALEPADRDALYYGKLRAQVHWVPARIGRETLLTPDHASRIMLAKAAAERAHLAEVGLSYLDVYALINAETSWVPRPGASRDGTPNLGVAQFEPATAKALGVRDPDDVVESVHAAAAYIREAALWSRDRLRGLKLGKTERERKLREGISVYYNLSVRGRNAWTGLNTDELPLETQRHIANSRTGAREAAVLEAQLREDGDI